MTDDLARARELAAHGAAAGQPLDWFEQLYAEAAAGESAVPWADLAVNPNLAGWGGLDPPSMRRALVTGCGYGDDAQYLASRGCAVTGGTLLVITWGRDPSDAPGSLPWPLLASELAPLAGLGLRELTFEDYYDTDTPPARHFRVTYHRERGCGACR